MGDNSNTSDTSDTSNASDKSIVERVKLAGLSIRKILSKEKERCFFGKCQENATVYMEDFYLCDIHAETLLNNLVAGKDLELLKRSEIKFTISFE